MRRCAEWTAGEMRRIGLENVRLIETPGNPIVYGDWLDAPGAPTILFYGHYDVQPVDPVESVGVAAVRGHRARRRDLRARRRRRQGPGVHALEGHRGPPEARTGRLPVNIRLIIEGEEEVGSVNLDDFIRENRALLAADVVVISDSAMFDRGVPSICYSLRGLVVLPDRPSRHQSDLHSGVFGGAVANPAMVLAQILAQMKDRAAASRFPGFYDDVLPLSDEERAAWQTLPFNEKKYRKELGAPKLFGESGYTVLERVWARPTFEVNGLLSGFTGEGAKTVIPAVAMAKVSMRLVPDQDPDKIADLFEAYLRKVAPKTVELTVTRMHGGKPWIAELRQRLRPGGRPRDRAGIRQGAGVLSRRWIDSGGLDLQGGARPAGRAVRRRPAGRERARAERAARPRQLPQRHRRVGDSLRRNCQDAGGDDGR